MLPPELLTLIFQLACDDDGWTARILALVSRSFYYCSLPFVYRTIAAHKATQAIALAELIRTKPCCASFVQHIFIAETTTIFDYSVFRETLRFLLELVSPTLLSLMLLIPTCDKNATSIFQIVFDISFPCLTRLTLCGDHPVPCSIDMPALQRFHTAGLVKHNAAGCLAPLTQSCPQLSHIRISMSTQHNLTYAISAAFNLPNAPTSPDQMYLEPARTSTEIDDSGNSADVPFPSLPRDLVSFSIKPAAPPIFTFPGHATIMYDQYMKQLKDLILACPPNKLQLLPAFKRDMWEVESYGVEQAKRDWLDAIKGGMGAWGKHGGS